MLVVHDRTSLAPGAHALRGAAIAIGNFDGVHLGHRALLETTTRLASRHGRAAAVLTFEPHPARFFAPASAPPLLLPLERRLQLLGEAGIDAVVVERFDAALAALTPDAFVRDILVTSLGVADVVVGYDFSFGRARSGDPQALTRLGRPFNLGVHIVPRVEREGLACSSTNIRKLASQGRVEMVMLLLGRPFEIEGHVVRGAGRGRALGVPTANVRPLGEVLPSTGIYAARAHLTEQAGGPWRAALSVGTNPTFTAEGAAAPVTVEAHLLDFAGEIYGQRLRLEVIKRLRDERRYDGVQPLLDQIALDVEETRRALP